MERDSPGGVVWGRGLGWGEKKKGVGTNGGKKEGWIPILASTLLGR